MAQQLRRVLRGESPAEPIRMTFSAPTGVLSPSDSQSPRHWHHPGLPGLSPRASSIAWLTLRGVVGVGPPRQRATVTWRNVAGMEVASGLELAFWELNKSCSSACRSSSRPTAAAASNAFIVGP